MMPVFPRNLALVALVVRAGRARPHAFATTLLILCAALPGIAATRTVTSLADDGSPGTLRSMIAKANPGDTINFGVTGTILLNSQLSISKNLTISGPGASNLAISGSTSPPGWYPPPVNYVRVFDINAATVSISGVTIQNGGDKSGSPGGGIRNIAGSVSITNCNIINNFGYFGGGGIYNSQGTVTVTNSTLTGNSTAAIGGGILNGYPDATMLTVTNSTLADNISGSAGGGIYHYSGVATVVNSTVSNNRTAHGAGIFAFGPIVVTFSTIANNLVNSGWVGEGSGIHVAGSSATLKANIFAFPSGVAGAVNCKVVSGSLISSGYNLSDDASCATSLTQPGDRNSTPARLDSRGLQDNGGPTQTIALLGSSPAVDAIPVSACTDTTGAPVTTDQRGVTRPQGSGCDIGAFEFSPTQALINSLTTTINNAPGVSLAVKQYLLGYVQQIPTAVASLSPAQKANAIANMNSFISDVNTLVASGALPAATGAQLVSLAGLVIAALQ